MMILVTLAVAWVLPFTCVSRAGQDEDAVPCVHLTVDLTDGSRLMGESPVESVVLHAPYGKLSLPFAQIRKIVLNADRETAQLTMANGDNLEGVIGLKDFELATIFGKIEVPVVHVVEMSVEKAELDRGLVAYYPFDEDAKDGSGNGNHGTVDGATWTEEGKIGGAYRFDGKDDYIDCGHRAALNFDRGEFSLSVWTRSRGTGYSVVLSKEQGKYRGWALRLMDTQTFIYFYAFESEGSYRDARHYESSVMDGRWHHIVCVKGGPDTKDLHIYVDSREVTSQVTGKGGSPDFSSTGALLVGTGPQGFFGGTIDEVRIYNRALSESEVRALHKMGQ